MRTLLLTALVAMAVCGCAPAEQRLGNSVLDGLNETVIPSQLRANEDAFDGKSVIVDGFVRTGPEASGIWDTLLDIDHARWRTNCVTLYDPERLIPSFGVNHMRVVGTYFKARPDGLVVLGSCGLPTFVLTKIVSSDGTHPRK